MAKRGKLFGHGCDYVYIEVRRYDFPNKRVAVDLRPSGACYDHFPTKLTGMGYEAGFSILYYFLWYF